MRTVTGGQAIEAALYEEMKRNDKVYYMGEDVGVFGGAITKLYKLYQNFPDRVIDTPLDEKGFTGVATGMAWMGLHPVVEFMYPDFLPLAMSHIAHGIAKQYFLSNQEVPTPITIRSAQGIGSQCGAHHSECVEGWLMGYNGIKLAVPTYPEDSYGLLKYSVRNDDPVIILDCRTTVYTEQAEIPDEENGDEGIIPFGVAKVRREGADVTILAWHKLLRDSLEAAEMLEAQGISCEVIDPRTLVPFDIDTLMKSIKKTGHLVIAHEANIRGSASGEISAMVLERHPEYLKAPIERVGAPNCFIPVGTVEWQMVPDKMDVLRAVKKTLGKELLPDEMGGVEVDVIAELKKSRGGQDLDA